MSVLARILLRYGSAFLITKGWLAPGLGEELAADPEILQAVEMGLGIALGAVSEGWYYLAKRYGLKT